MKESDVSQGGSASELISKRIAELGDWRGKTLSRMRELIKEADPDVIEEWKWVKPTTPGTPVWSHDGIICTGESYKSVVKLTFAKGASLNDPGRLFNSSLEGNVRRAIDIHEGEDVDATAFKALVRSAVALNGSGRRSRRKRSPKPSSKGVRDRRDRSLQVSTTAGNTSTKSAKVAENADGKRVAAKAAKPRKAVGRSSARKPAKPTLLSGGNPQIAKGEGAAPVRAYIAAMPGWKRHVGRPLDALIVRTVPGVPRRSNGTRRSTASMARPGSSTSIL